MAIVSADIQVQAATLQRMGKQAQFRRYGKARVLHASTVSSFSPCKVRAWRPATQNF